MAADVILTMDNFKVVYKAVREARKKWREIGIEFEFAPSDMDDIERQCGLNDDRCLQALLEKWLKKRSIRPTWKSLVTVLREDTVGEEGVAADIEEKYVNSSAAGNQSAPEIGDVSDKDQLMDKVPEGMKQRKRSALYFPEEEGGVAKLLKIQKTAVDLDPMESFAGYLKEVYANSPIAPRCKEDPTPPAYISLAIIKKEHATRAEADAFTKATLCGGIDEIAHKKEPICLEDIFKASDDQATVKCVFVEGAPGVGKSMFAWELCRRWDDIEAMRTRFLAVVLLRLREKRVREATDVGHLVLYPDDPDLQKEITRMICSTRGEGILLVLDGFDEFPKHLRESNSSLVANVIQGKCLSNATVLVTSRPSARQDLLSLRSKPDKHIEVLGFTSTQIYEYASCAFNYDTAVLAQFCTYISSNPAIRGMMYVPVNTAIVTEVYRENKSDSSLIPQTMTQLYTELTLTRFRRHLTDVGQSRETLPRTLEDLPKTLLNQLVKLGKLAFEATKKQKVIFDSLEGCDPLGLMTESQELYIGKRGPVSYNFFHLTLQEFLSAFYLSQCSAAEKKDAFMNCSGMNFTHMDVVWTFLAGLTGLQGSELNYLASRMIQAPRKSSFVVQCVYEAQEKMDCKSVLASEFLTFSSRSVYDWFCVGYCVSSINRSWTLYLETAEAVEMLVHGLRSKDIRGSVKSLVFIQFQGGDIVAQLRTIPHKILQELKVLKCTNCQVDLGQLAEFTPVMADLESLDIFGDLAASGLGKLLQSLCDHRQLHSLCVMSMDVSPDDVPALSQLINGTLRELILGVKNMECVEMVTKTVLSPSSLRKLALCGMNFCSTSLDLLEANKNLTHLALVACTLGTKDITSIAETLKNNTALKELMLGKRTSNYFTIRSSLQGASMFELSTDQNQLDCAFQLLADSLKSNTTLTLLEFGFIQHPACPELIKEAALTLVRALKYNKTLETLHLYGSLFKCCDRSLLWSMDPCVHMLVEDHPKLTHPEHCNWSRISSAYT